MKPPKKSEKPVKQSSVVHRRDAIRESQFIPYFQPIVLMRSGELAGFEILARAENPELGLLAPDQFIPLAEANGWIDIISEQLLRKAFAASYLIPEPLTLSINISPVQLRHAGLPALIRDAAESAGFRLGRLVIEITESALIGDTESALSIVLELKGLGCKLALDDFGTGYSSLLHLQSLPFDELKVDRSFVMSMTERRESRKIVAAVVGLGQSLGLRTVAEGIETEEQAEILLWLGCELGQGWLYGRPVAADGIVAVVSAPRQSLSTRPLSPWKRISTGNLEGPLSQRLAQLQALYDGAPVGLAFIDQDLRYVNLNRKLARMNGSSVEAHLGSKVSDMVPDLFPKVEPFMRRALAGEAIPDVLARFPISGETRLLSYQPARDEAGEVIGFCLAVIDITERVRAEEKLRANEESLRSKIGLTPRSLWITDTEGLNPEVIPQRDKSTGRIQKRQPDHGWLHSVHPEDLPRAVVAIAASRRSGALINVEFRVADGQDRWRWMRARGSPLRDMAGKIVGWHGTVEDIDLLEKSEYTRSERASEASLARLRVWLYSPNENASLPITEPKSNA